MGVEDLLKNFRSTKNIFDSIRTTPDVLKKQVEQKRDFFLAGNAKISIDNPEIESALLEAIDDTGFPEEVATEVKTRVCNCVSADSCVADAQNGILATTK